MTVQIPQDGFATVRLSEVASDQSVLDQLIGCFIGAFNATGESEWGETWTEETARHRLIVAPGDEIERTNAAIWCKDGKMKGFALTLVGDPDVLVRESEMPSGHNDSASVEAVRRNLDWLAGPIAKLMFGREVAIPPENRAKGDIRPVQGLMYHSVHAALLEGADYFITWIIKGCKVYPIYLGIGTELVYDFMDAKRHMFVGTRTLQATRRLSSPPKEFVKMIAERSRWG